MFEKLLFLVRSFLTAPISLFQGICQEFVLFFGAFRQDLVRISLLAGIGWYLLAPTPADAKLLTFSFGLTILALLVGHLARKIFFRHIDLEDYSRSALAGNQAAASVFRTVTFASCFLMVLALLPLLTR